MVIILGKQYITDKEAAAQFGYSRDWFKRQRWKGEEPMYFKLKGKVLYSYDDLKKWFGDRLSR